MDLGIRMVDRAIEPIGRFMQPFALKRTANTNQDNGCLF